MDTEMLLREAVQDGFENLKTMEPGTEEYKSTVDSIAKLVDRENELNKINLEHLEKVKSRKFENETKLKQMEEEKVDRRIKNGIAAGGVILPTLVTVWGVLKSLKFETTGTVTTLVGRGFLNKLIPKK